MRQLVYTYLSVDAICKTPENQETKLYIGPSRSIASWARGSESEKKGEEGGAKRRPFRTTDIKVYPSHLNAEPSTLHDRPVYTIPSDTRYPHSLLNHQSKQ